MRNEVIIRIGTRGSRLAVAQTTDALKRIRSLLPVLHTEIMTVVTSGDCDRSTDLRVSDPDFFTRELDDAVLGGEVDCAVHSAKDMPDPVRDGLDWFWLPWREDPRDVLIFRGGTAPAPGRRTVVGVSSGRREDYCRKRFPDAEMSSIRGNIEERIAQLDAGKYDVIILAAAGLKRLGLDGRIGEYVGTDELAPPPGQGYLAMTFRAGDARFLAMRGLFVKSVIFAGAGPGGPGLATLDCISALECADVCLYDALADEQLLDRLPHGSEKTYVGKRSGGHSVGQDEICRMIATHARRGKRVVRLKGGDPGVFGRLAEEVGILDSLSLPYCVIPGISSMLAATTGTGLLLTRRGVSRGFSAVTPRKAGSQEFEPVGPEERAGMPLVFFMGAGNVGPICRQMIAEGRSPDHPAALVFGAGTLDEKIVCSTLSKLESAVAASAESGMPGLLVVGDIADGKYLYRSNGALAGARILLTCSDALMARAVREVIDLGGRPIPKSLIAIRPEPGCVETLKKLSEYDWVVLTSPSAVECLVGQMRTAGTDLRALPYVISCGPGTSVCLKDHGIIADIEAGSDFGAAGLLDAVRDRIGQGERVLRLCSDKAGSAVREGLKSLGAEVDDVILYHNEDIAAGRIPEFDAVVFCSGSAVESFVRLWTASALAGKQVSVIGGPTRQVLKRLAPLVVPAMPSEATVQEAIRSLAAATVVGKIIEST